MLVCFSIGTYLPTYDVLYTILGKIRTHNIKTMSFKEDVLLVLYPSNLFESGIEPSPNAMCTFLNGKDKLKW